MYSIDGPVALVRIGDIILRDSQSNSNKKSFNFFISNIKQGRAPGLRPRLSIG